MTAPAKTVDEAYWDRLWFHDQDVWSTTGDDYVPRTHDGPAKPVHLKLVESLRRARGDIQYLLTGQVGCGKSTELQRVVVDSEVRKGHVVLVLNASARLNLTRFVDVRMVLIAIAAELAERIQSFDPSRAGAMGFAVTKAQAVREWIRVLGTRHGDLPDPTQVSPRQFLSDLTEKLLGVPADLKSDDQLRTALQEAEVSQVRELVVLLHEVLAKVSGCTVLVVIDDTDKIRDPETAEHLFQKQLSTLRSLPFRWIMTMPYGLRFDPDAQIPQELVVTLPNIKVVKREVAGLLEGARGFFRSLLFRHVEPALVDDEVIEGAALLSAGIPREFLRVVHRAFGIANDTGADRVQRSHLELAAAQLRREIQPLHADPAIKRQLEVLRLRQDELGPEQRRLMGTLLVVEYTNDTQWYDVHPLLVPEYDRRLDARAARRKIDRSDVDALVADLLGEGEKAPWEG